MTEFSPTQKLTIVKHLASGKSADVVAVIMHAPETDIVAVAKHHGYPDVDKLKWAADILEKKVDRDEALPERPAPSSAAGAHPIRQSRPGATIAPAVPPTSPSRPDDTRVLINTAKAHPSKKIQSAADRASDAISKLRQLLVEDEKKNHEKRKAAAEKAAARAEVERLEAELRAAKARLRTTVPTPAAAAKTAKKTSTAPRGEYPCRNDGCTEVITTPQGRGLHERQHCAHRVEAAS